MEKQHKGIIVITHSIHKRISKEEAFEALSKKDKELLPNIEFIDVSPVQVPIGEGDEIDWSEAVAIQRRIVDEQISPLLSKHPNYKLIYFGAAPIPLAINLGFLVGSWAKIEVRLFHHVHKNWNWTSLNSNITLINTGIPNDQIEGEGEIIFKVLTSYPIQDEDTYEIIEKPLKKISVSVESPGKDSLACQNDVDIFGNAFKDGIDAISNHLRNASRIHLFASVPVGMAFIMGTKISSTIHKNIQVYQYKETSNPRYFPALVVQGIPEPTIILNDEDERQVQETRISIRENLDNQIKPFIKNINKEKQDWFARIISKPKKKKYFLSAYWAKLPGIDSTILSSSEVDISNNNIPEEGFGFEREKSKWQFGDTFLHIINQRILDPGNRERGLRILLFHESLHYRGHKLTGSTVPDVGRFPKILEEVDYQADVWAIFHEFAFSKLYKNKEIEDYSHFFRNCIKTATEMMWAFDDRGIDLLEMQIRRMNRYLIWYWQYIRLTHEKCNSLNHIIEILADKPVIEIHGLSIISRGPRVFYQFDKSHSRNLELGVLWRNIIERRAGSGALQLSELISGFKRRDGNQIIEVLTSLFDQLSD